MCLGSLPIDYQVVQHVELGALTDSSPVILIAHDVLERITADAASFAGRKERGGILIGLRRGPHIEIRDATLPMRWDFSTFISFRRSPRGHQSVALRRWRESSHTLDWVGEWHSHPEKHPRPSSIDLRSWRAAVEGRGAPMVFVIVGYAAKWVSLAIPGSLRPIEYRQSETSSAGIAFVDMSQAAKS